MVPPGVSVDDGTDEQIQHEEVAHDQEKDKVERRSKVAGRIFVRGLAADHAGVNAGPHHGGPALSGAHFEEAQPRVVCTQVFRMKLLDS